LAQSSYHDGMLVSNRGIKPVASPTILNTTDVESVRMITIGR